MRKTMKTILNHRWSRFFAFTGIGVLVAAVLLYALAQFYDFGVLEFVLIAVVIIFISDIVLAWNNERAIQQGKVKLHNDILGKDATVIETFSPEDARFKGKVSLSGERWAANSSAALTEGEIVQVQAREGLVLSVERHA
jgi:membrane protein implicated in regulation of membrane protease activity